MTIAGMATLQHVMMGAALHGRLDLHKRSAQPQKLSYKFCDTLSVLIHLIHGSVACWCPTSGYLSYSMFELLPVLALQCTDALIVMSAAARSE